METRRPSTLTQACGARRPARTWPPSAAPRGVAHPEVLGQRTLEVAALTGLQGRGRIGPAHRCTLRFVGVQQRLVGPAADHPGQLPAEVVAVGDPGVHPGRAARRRPVRRITDQEDRTGPLPLGDRGAEVVGEDAQNLGLQAGQARGGPDAPGQTFDRPLGQTLAGLRMPLHVVEPPAGPTRRHEHPLDPGRHRRRQDERHLRHHGGQVGPEQRAEVVALRTQLLDADAQPIADRAAAAVRADQVAGRHGLDLVRPVSAQARPGPPTRRPAGRRARWRTAPRRRAPPGRPAAAPRAGPAGTRRRRDGLRAASSASVGRPRETT